jgi:hypothetical protein
MPKRFKKLKEKKNFKSGPRGKKKNERKTIKQTWIV